MPRPHHHHSGRTHPKASDRWEAEAVSAPGSLSKLQQENARLKAEVDRLRKAETAPPMNSRSVMWMACGLCGVALLFALAVLFRR